MKLIFFISILTILTIPLIVSALHTVTINSPSAGWYNETIQIDYEVSVSPSSCYLIANGEVRGIACLTNVAFNTNNCDDGENTCVLEIVATANGQNATGSVTISVDNSPPEISFVVLDKIEASEGENINITSDGNDPHGIMSCYAILKDSDGENVPEGSWNLGNDCSDTETLPDVIEEGNYTINIRVRNRVSAESWASTHLLINNDMPLANLIYPTEGEILNGTVVIEGTASDQYLVNYRLEVCDGSCTEIYTSQDSVTDDVLHEWNSGSVANGEYTLNLIVTDKAGNEVIDSVDITVNNTMIFPHELYGKVSVGGVRLINGSVLKAKINGVEYEDTEIINGEYGIEPVFSVPGDNMTTDNKEGGINGETIEFFIDGTRTNEIATFSSGKVEELDLTISTNDILDVTRHSDNQEIKVLGKETVDCDIEIKTDTDVDEMPITLSKFDNNFFGGLGDTEKFLKTISVEMDEYDVEYFILKVYYSNQELSTNDLNEGKLLLFKYDEDDMAWEAIGINYNHDENYVWANLTEASIFALVGDQTCDDGIRNQGESDIDCGGPCSACPEPDDGDSDCTEDWDCTRWSLCTDGIQTRDCEDDNDCGTTENKPSTYRECDEEICDDGEKRCSPEGDVEECDDGSEWVTIEDCLYGCADGECFVLEVPDNGPETLQDPTTDNITGNEGGAITGGIPAEMTGLVVVVIIIIILATAYYFSGREKQPVYEKFRYTYRP